MSVMARLLILIGLFGAVAIATPVMALEPICSTPAVVFCEDWEAGALPGRWADGYDPSRHQIVTSGYQGSRSLQVTWPAGGEGGWLTSWFTPTGVWPSSPTAGYDHVFVRLYWRRAANWQCWPSSNACGKMIAQYGLQTGMSGPFNPWSGFGKAGVCPSGSDFYYSAVVTATTPSPETFALYAYYPEMTPCPGWGIDFYSSMQMPLDQWVCLEQEVQANTPGQHDGLQRMWVNGTLAREVTGLRWRDTMNVQQGALQLTFSGSGANLPMQQEWIDNIVVSTQRVGCGIGVGTVPSNPTNVQVN